MWETKTLGEVCTFTRGLTYKKSDEVQSSKNVVLRANNISLERGELDFEELKYIRPDIDVPASKKLRFGSLLICTASGSKKHLGKIAYVDADYDYAFGGFMGLVTPNDEIDGKFLYRCMTSKRYFDFIQELSDGININNLKFSQLSDFNIPVPPLPKQKRIVAILDEVFEGIDAAIANTEKNLANAHELFESHLNNIFTEKGEGWVDTHLKGITTKIGSGATPRGGANSYKAEGISLIRSLNVYDRQFSEGKLAFIDDRQAEKLSNVIVKNGDVLFNITGASIARCCIAPTKYLPARVNQHVSILRPIQERLSSSFLCYLMTSRPYKKHLLGVGDEGGSTRQAITKSQLQELLISLPPTIERQADVVSHIDEQASLTRRLEAVYGAKREQLKSLKQSLLAKAFSGELTAQSDRVLKEATA